MSGKFTLAQHYVEAYPQAAARVLEDMASDAASTFIDAVPDQQSSNLLSSMLPYHAAKCVSHLSASVAARYLGELEPRASAAILRHVQVDQRDEILDGMPRQRSTRIAVILNYSLSMVGAWVEPSVLVLPADCSIGEAQQRLKNEGYPDYHRIYVVDADLHLKGFVKIVRLIQADNDSPLAAYLEPADLALRANMSLDTAMEHSGWLETDYLPVIDRRDKFLGVLSYAALRSAAGRPRPVSEEQDVSGTFMDLAETCYLGLAEVMSTSLAVEKPAIEIEERKNDRP